MFFLIPFVIFLVSSGTAIYVIARKFTYLTKLNPEAINGSAMVREGFWTGFFPGLASRIKEVNTKEMRVNFLGEFEKFLRKLRLASLKLDAFTNRLIHRVRKSAAYHEEILSKESAVVEEPMANGGEKTGNLKGEEQCLIIEIAKNPKDAQLYKELGSLYVKMKIDQDAFESFKKAHELDPEDTEAKTNLEKISSRLGK